MAQSVYLKKGSTTIYIEVTKVEEILVNKLIKVVRPVTKSSQNTKNPGTMLVDIKKVEHVFNIIGFISVSSESGNLNATWSQGTITTAKDAKNALIRDIFYPSGDIQLYYRDYNDLDYGSFYGDGSSVPGGTSYISTQLDKVSISDIALRADDSSGTSKFPIQINLTRGKTR